MEYRVLGSLEVSRGNAPLALGGPKQLVVYAGGNHSIAFTTASTKGPNPRDIQADWLAERIEGKPFANERWYVDYDGAVAKEKLA